jgi:hypothetical protein
MYTSCQRQKYDINEAFTHANKIIEDLKKEINLYITVEPHLRKYNGKVLNCRIQKYFEELFPEHRIYYYNRYQHYTLSITPNKTTHNLHYDIELAYNNGKNVRYEHTRVLAQIETLKKRLTEYTQKLDGITEAVMKYNMAYDWFKKADEELYNAIPNMCTFDTRRY